MKKHIFSLIFAFFSLSAFAVNLEDFSFSVEPLFGMKWGQIDEYVFLKESNFSDDKLSELNWEIKPEWYCGLRIGGEWKKFFAETSVSFGIPKNTGLMMDSDWLNNDPASVSPKIASKASNWKTNYSESDNYLNYDINFSLKGGYNFQVLDWLKILPALSFDYENIKFTAKNGTKWYGSSSANGYYLSSSSASAESFSIYNKYGYNGTDIEYNRIIYNFWLGSDFSIKLPKNFEFKTGFFFSPYIYAVSYDSHVLKAKVNPNNPSDYADLTIGFFGAFKWNWGISYKITERHFVSLNASYFYMRVLRGDDYQKSSNENSYKKASDADGGAGAKYFDITLSYRFKIF